MVTKAYVSSTYADLVDYRKAVRHALRRLRIDEVAMESYVAGDERPLDKCLADVAECDLYIGVFAWRYGFVPPGQTRSITELEYRKARELGKECLIFLLREEAPWPRTFMDLGERAGPIERLRRELSAEHVCGFFTRPDDLANEVVAAVADRLVHGRHAVPAKGLLSTDRRTAYYRRLRQKYGGLDLDSLTPPQADEYLRIGLTSVFVEQHVRADSPPAELPREWLERLISRGELDPEDVPDTVVPAELESLRDSYRAKPVRPLFEMVAMPESRAIVVLGDPGSGKSTVARYLALTLAGLGVDDRLAGLSDHLPILIELRSYVAALADRRCANFLEYLDHRSSVDGLGIERDILERYLSFGGRALVVFDGLDEVFQPHSRAEIANQIVDFQTRYPNVRVIVTSRIIGYSRGVFTDAGFAHFTLQDLDEDQVGEFLSRWYRLALPERAGDAEASRLRLVEAMRRSAALRELAGNPLLLTILAIIGKHQVLPRDRWALYDHATTVLVEHWDVNRQLGGGDEPAFIDAADKKALLRRLAYHMQSSPRTLSANYIEQDDLSRVFEQYLRERYQMSLQDAKSLARAMITKFHERNFILSRYGLNLYGFVHRTFLEFFCADAMVAKFQHDQEWRLGRIQRQFREHWADASWREVLRLVAGALHERHTASLISLLTREVNIQWPPGRFPEPPWNLALAVQCLGEARNLHTDLAGPAEALLRKLILLLEHSVGRTDPELAMLIGEEIMPAARAIGANWPGRQVYLRWYRRRGVRLVWGPTMTFAAQLAAILATPADHLEELFDGELTRIADNRASLAAVAGLAELAGPRPADSPARAVLERRGCEDRHAGVRLAAVQALGERFGVDERLTDVLIERAGRDGSAGVRQAAVLALSERHRAVPRARALIAERARDDPSATVRRAAARALSTRFPSDSQLRAVLFGLLRGDRDAEVVTTAAQALLERFGATQQVRDLLLKRADRDAEGGVRRAAIRLLGERWAHDAEVARLLLRCIDTETDAGALCEAARCFISLLLEGERSRARDGLIARMAGDPDEGIRLAIVQVLAEQFPEDERVRAATVERAGADHDATVRLAAVTALVRRAADDTLIRAVLETAARTDGDWAVRSAALHGLVGGDGHGTATRALVIDLARGDAEPRLREQAVEILAEQHGGHPAAQRVIADLCRNDGSPDVRLAAARRLAQLDDVADVARKALVDRVRNDPDGPVFACAAEAVLDWLESAENARILLFRRALRDINARVRLAAAELLGRLHAADTEAQRVLLRLVRADLDADVVHGAAVALARSVAAAEQLGVLARRATDSNPAVRQAVLRVLGEHYAEAPVTLRILVAAVRKDDEASVRRAALSLLAERCAERKGVRDTVVEALHDPAWTVRRHAVLLLGQWYGAEERTWRLLAGLAADRSDPQLSLRAGQTLSWLPGAEPERMPTLINPD